MKLSELNTKEDYDLLCDLILEVTTLVQSDGFTKVVVNTQKELGNNNEVSTFEFARLLLEKKELVVNEVLKSNKKQIFKILSLLNKKTVKEIEEQPLFKTIGQVFELFKDEELMGFFKSQVNVEETD